MIYRSDTVCIKMDVAGRLQTPPGNVFHLWPVGSNTDVATADHKVPKSLGPIMLIGWGLAWVAIIPVVTTDTPLPMC